MNRGFLALATLALAAHSTGGAAHGFAGLAACPGGGTPSLRELEGRIVHLVFTGSDTAARLRELAAAGKRLGHAGVITVVAGAAPEADAVCRADDSDVAAAYATVAGTDGAALAGTEFLVDATGGCARAGRQARRRIGETPDLC